MLEPGAAGMIGAVGQPGACRSNRDDLLEVRGHTVDQHRLATLTRTLTSIPSRRDELRGLLGAGIGFGAHRLSDTTKAKKKRKKKKADLDPQLHRQDLWR